MQREPRRRTTTSHGRDRPWRASCRDVVERPSIFRRRTIVTSSPRPEAGSSAWEILGGVLVSHARAAQTAPASLVTITNRGDAEISDRILSSSAFPRLRGALQADARLARRLGLG